LPLLAAADRTLHGKISGPLLDRIDLHIEVPAVAFKELSTSPRDEQRRHARAGRRGAANSAAAVRRGENPLQRAHDDARDPQILPLDEESMELLRASVQRTGLVGPSGTTKCCGPPAPSPIWIRASDPPAHVQEAGELPYARSAFWT